MKLRVLSLFAGIGGFDLGLERAGMEVVGQVEIDSYCNEILTKHWPNVPRFGDIRTVGAADVQRECGGIDLICGGFPCQDISAAGKGAGLTGERSGLWFEMYRIISELLPEWLLIENVPALRTRGADVVTACLEGQGYAVWPLVVGAWAVGAPHKRDRVWIVANRDGNAIRKQSRRIESGRESAPVASGDDKGLANPDGEFGRTKRNERRGSMGAAKPQRSQFKSGRELEHAKNERLEGEGEGLFRFPSGPDRDQFKWEEPREIESQMGLTTDGIPVRLALKAIGNSVVPQIVEAIGKVILKMAAKAHSPLGASTASRWFPCSKSPQMIADSPEPPKSRYAAEGTVAHAVAEDALKNLLKRDPWQNYPIGSIRIADGFRFPITQEMLDAVGIYVDFVKEIISKYEVPNDLVFLEQKITIPNSHGADLRGTADLVVLIPYNRLIVADYKHGAGTSVSVYENKQLLYYALGAWLALPDDVRDEIPTIEVVIVQPREAHTGKDAVERWEFPAERLLEFQDELLDAVARTRGTNPVLKAGEWCKFCPAKINCPEYVNAASNIASLDFANLPAVIQKPKVDIFSLNGEQLAYILDHEHMVKALFEAAAERALALAESGVEIPGYVRTKKRANRAWIDEFEVVKSLAPILGNAIYSEPKLKSPAQMEVLAGKDMLEDLYEKPDNGYVLARTDKGNKKTSSAIMDFS
jgi:DNA (cytosine-5)-methyltransferase 1